MNFIEAALVIQGSACIYSKKVRKSARKVWAEWGPDCIPFVKLNAPSVMWKQIRNCKGSANEGEEEDFILVVQL